VLDVGCGTGVFLEKARRAGFKAEGIDASPQMVAAAARRLGSAHVQLTRMQDLDAWATYDAIVALSWSFNYCSSMEDAGQILKRCFQALRPGGRLILQLAHAEHANGALSEDREPGPDGDPDDVLFLYRFTKIPGKEPRLKAEYVYACRSLDELLCESHELNAADAKQVASLAQEIGFRDLKIYDSSRREVFQGALSPFLLASREKP
jgi:SAM-dependent methyltransferase